MGFQRGLKIPVRIKKELTPSIIKLLTKDGHGLSFPGGDLVQMRYINSNITTI